jgi:hypothetical protein
MTAGMGLLAVQLALQLVASRHENPIPAHAV